MRVAFGMGQPEQLTFAWLHPGKRRSKHGLRVMLRGQAGGGEELFGNLFDGGRARTPPVVAQQVGGYAEKVAAAGYLSILKAGRSCGAEKAHVRLLHEVVG